MHEAVDALRQAQIFLSDVAGPRDTDDEQHALGHASRLAETAAGIDIGTVRGGPDEARAGQLCAEAMQIAISVADDVAVLPGQSPRAASAASGAKALSTDEALVQLESCATELEKLRRSLRSETLGAVANRMLTADAAIARVDTLRSLQALAGHAWRSIVYLVGPDKASRCGLHRGYGLLARLEDHDVLVAGIWAGHFSVSWLFRAAQPVNGQSTRQ